MVDLMIVDGPGRGLCNEYVGVVLNGDDGISVGVPGEIWTDEYIALRVHEEGCEIVDQDGIVRDSLEIQITLEQLNALRTFLDEAETVVRQRGMRTQEEYRAAIDRIAGKD